MRRIAPVVALCCGCLAAPTLAQSTLDFPTGQPVPLALEMQGEAVAFDAEGRNYFSVSEGLHASLYFYERVPEPVSLLALLWGLASVPIIVRRRRACRPQDHLSLFG